MRHQIRIGLGSFALLIARRIGFGDGGDLIVAARQADQARAEAGDERLEHIGRVARRIDRDEDRLDPRGGSGVGLSERGKAAHQFLKVNRADVGAISVAEIDDGIFAGEVALGIACTVLVDQREGSADRRAGKRRFGSLRGRGRASRKAGQGHNERDRRADVHDAARHAPTAVQNQQSVAICLVQIVFVSSPWPWLLAPSPSRRSP